MSWQIQRSGWQHCVCHALDSDPWEWLDAPTEQFHFLLITSYLTISLKYWGRQGRTQAFCKLMYQQFLPYQKSFYWKGKQKFSTLIYFSTILTFYFEVIVGLSKASIPIQFSPMFTVMQYENCDLERNSGSHCC